MVPSLLTPFRRALRLVLADRGDVAKAIRRGYRTLQAYEYGQLRVTPAVARSLAVYMRKRAAAFLREARRLERAAGKGD
jgi:hypothetical protein